MGVKAVHGEKSQPQDLKGRKYQHVEAAEQRQLLIQQEGEERERQRKLEAVECKREERRRKLELADIHRQRELLKVTQELQQANLENQVWEVELERGEIGRAHV